MESAWNFNQYSSTTADLYAMVSGGNVEIYIVLLSLSHKK